MKTRAALAERNFRLRRKALGLCQNCSQPAQKTRCPICSLKQSLLSKKRFLLRKTLGLCRRCQSVSGKYRLCLSCRLHKAHYSDQQRQARLAAGLCAVCGKEPHLPNKKHGPDCARKNQLAVQRCRQKQAVVTPATPDGRLNE